MDDKKIIDLFFKRSEKAIHETKMKYGRYCHYIAYNILHNDEDAEECVSDTFVKAWNSIPPAKPDSLKAFLGRIARNSALDKLEKTLSQKRGADCVTLVLDELHECIPEPKTVESVADNNTLKKALDAFLLSLDSEKRNIFMRRYWYLCPIKEIASDFKLSESKVKMTLLRTRKKLKNFLEKEGIEI